MIHTLHETISLHTQRTPDKAALLAPGRKPLNYGQLDRQIHDTLARFNNLGIGRKDRVALALPNGPDAASAFLCVTACAVAVPLNPAYTAAEWRESLRRLNINALLTIHALETPAAVARELGIDVIYLQADDTAGCFTLSGELERTCKHPGFTTIDDMVLIVQTSSTSATPKAVPHSLRNIAARLQQNKRLMQLNRNDRGINMMPLFHGHAMSNGVYTPLGTGASTICLPGFDAEVFFTCLRTLEPTFYSASFTHQQAILAWLEREPHAAAGHQLRFIRSGSGPLPPLVEKKLTAYFKTPVLQYCGSTETGCIASNPLPPGIRKPGTIGIPWDNEVIIMDQNKQQSAGSIGEVWIRGDAVVSGYDNDPEMTAEAFVDGWFHTGDLGFFDDDGYLTLCGKIKDIINRGGQKISPSEIDAALLEHAEVLEACAFSVPHSTLGEAVAAAVVLKPKARTDTDNLRRFLQTKLASFKLPSPIIITDAIPKTPNGKHQRRKLARHYGLNADKPQINTHMPKNGIERQIAEIWASVLSLNPDPVSHESNFIDLGGNSLLATQIINRIYKIFNFKLSPSSLFINTDTIATMAELIQQNQKKCG